MSDEQVAPDGPDALTHVTPDGAVLMVDVSDKAITKRQAHAEATLNTRPDVIAMLVAGSLPKGEALATARIAGIMGAKQTSSLIPLCHPLPLSGATVDFTAETGRVIIRTMVKTTGVTGVEMEALTAASIAALTLYDMIKAVDRHASITDIRVVSKSGGKSGDWVRPVGSDAATAPARPGDAGA
ncbi:cyclic pyranopterin monophosphate synthase MoaC [Subtercola boreus]|uniref:Cyclic pyranopterin monophosphate synthase n=1 Tax=Subtercola boreus TaxID=120213 RepID=A0A3E0WCB5_9MICO|nr:cyclic pyranopterin monophosphate synthase MoaC [Subtercola boreus]RFA22005.1 cyclic pyranopterin monophosphate synthase MoaC [Subtercola boreus]RFA22185.1 cyclic pyranopterin monophosphate synthase MoaC [Subtercola boreus]RFA28047.1 cyclic pyranopterin monophosphate synthase MoaC [Subtercola boreus]